MKTGPGRKVKSLERASNTSEPVRSPGIRSGVNCTRLVSTSSAAARARTSSVLATPGTPSSRMCPRQSSATSSPATAASWPTTALATSARTASSAERARWASADAVRPGARAAGWPAPACGRRAPGIRRRCGVRGSAGGRAGGVVGHGWRTLSSRSVSCWARWIRARSSGGAGPNRMSATSAGRSPGGGAARRAPAHRAGAAADGEPLDEPVVRARAQHGGGAAPVAGAAVEAAAALGGLDGAHHDGQRLAHEAAQPAAAGEREQHDGDHRAARSPGRSTPATPRGRRWCPRHRGPGPPGRRSTAGTRAAAASSRGRAPPVPAWLSLGDHLVGPRGREAGDDDVRVRRGGVELHHGRAERAVRVGLVGRPVGRGHHEARAWCPGRRGPASGCSGCPTARRRRSVRATSESHLATRSPPPPGKASRGSPSSCSCSPPTPSSTSRPASRADAASRALAPAPRLVGSPTNTVVSASGRAASRSSIERTTSTSTPWPRSTSARARAPSGPVPSGSSGAVGRWADSASSTTTSTPRATARDVGAGAAHPVAGPSGPRAWAPAPRPGRWWSSSRARRGGRVREHRPGRRQGGVERRSRPGPTRSWRRGGRSARRRRCRRRAASDEADAGNTGRQRHGHLVRGAARAGRRAGCARRRTGRGRGRPRARRSRGRRASSAARAAARCSAAVRVGPSSTPLRRRPVIRALGAQRAPQHQPDHGRPDGQGDPAPSRPGSRALPVVPSRPVSQSQSRSSRPSLLVVDALAQLVLEPLPRLGRRGVQGWVESHRVSGPRRHSATGRVRPAGPRG